MPIFIRHELKNLIQRGMLSWLRNHLRGESNGRPVLAVLERVALGPRQSLTLVEAHGHQILVATAPECAPTFLALDGTDRREPELDSPRPTGAIPVRGIVC